MAYSINPNLPKARKIAINLVLRDKLPVAVVAHKCGIHRTTVWRWVNKWHAMLASHEVAGNRGNPYIPTLSSRPHHSPSSLPKAIVETIIALRKELGRCARVIHETALLKGIRISLASVSRIICRYGLTRPTSKWKRYRKFSKRPRASSSGELVEVDTVHFYHPITKCRKYATSVIDVYSRMAYVLLHDGMQQYSSLEAVLKAQDYMGIGFKTVQTDNGPEFGKKFQDEIRRRGMNYRHIRVRRPNDNAHIERFNRTLREECLGNYFPSAETLKHTQKRLSSWLDYYNYKRLHLGLQCRVPANVAKVLR